MALLACLFVLPLQSSAAVSLPYIDTTTEADGVVALPSDVDEVFSNLFAKYTKLVAPNGKPIHILAHEDVEDEIVFHASQVMRQHLQDVDDTEYGDDKTDVWNALSDNGAILAIFGTQDQVEDNEDFDVLINNANVQDLKQDEIFLEGTERYLADFEPGRNAAYEEILHLVQDYGITPGNPEMQSAINDALDNAISEEIYTPLSDLEEESYDQEYLAIGMEVFYGFWQHNPSGDGKAGGEEYAYITRSALEANDASLYDILTNYFSPYVSYTALVDSDFSGTFSVSYDSSTTYTNKSQYLKNVALQGTNDVNLTGNSTANMLIGNAGDNSLTGGAGNDTLFGSAGTDTAVFSGNQAEYTVADTGCRTTVTDGTSSRDGVDILSGIEFIEYSDATVAVSQENDQPVLNTIYNQNTPLGTAIDLTLIATDQDEDDIIYTATSDESDVEVSVDGAVLTATPVSGFEGSATITATASDGSCSASQEFILYVYDTTPEAQVIADYEKDENSIFIRYEDDTEEEIMPFGNSQKFRVQLSTDSTRLVATNGKLVRVFVNGERVTQKRISKKAPKKLKHLRMQVVSFYNNYDNVVTAWTRKKKGYVSSLRLTDSDTLTKKKNRSVKIQKRIPTTLKTQPAKKRIILQAGKGSKKVIERWKLKKNGVLKKLQ